MKRAILLYMRSYAVTENHVKMWVVLNAHVNNPYGKYWSAAVTIGYDYYGKGDTIEQAYNDMVQQILKSPSIMAKLKEYESFVSIVKSK